MIFWRIHRGKEIWLTRTKFQEFRQNKNALARKNKQGRHLPKRQAWTKAYSKTPKRKAYSAAYQRKHRAKYSANRKEARAAYKKRRMETDPFFKLKATIGTRIRCSFRRQCVRKQTKCIDLLGCTYPQFRDWISARFEPGMTLKNYGFDTWHIDHIIPVGLFDLSDSVAQRYAFNYRNCRPAWGKDNLERNKRLDMALVAKHELWEWLPYLRDNQLPLAA